MIPVPSMRLVIPAMWLFWALLWAIAALRTKRTRWRESLGLRLSHLVPVLACWVLLAAPRRLPPVLRMRIVPDGRILPLLGAVLVAAALGFALWARVHLGGNWSGLVTLKEGHALVRTGPYRVVRHPIYTGLLLAVIGTAAAIGEWRGVLALACALVGLVIKIRAEEALMRRTFPEYAAYRKTTAALIPLLY
jgi:protein-S-isoprenylcysteine O-methyltransferase Ste14